MSSKFTFALLVVLVLSACGKREVEVLGSLVPTDDCSGHIYALSVADIDGDGKPDIVYSKCGKIFILKHMEDGRFAPNGSKGQKVQTN